MFIVPPSHAQVIHFSRRDSLNFSRATSYLTMSTLLEKSQQLSTKDFDSIPIMSEAFPPIKVARMLRIPSIVIYKIPLPASL
jgi:hypothetical protein